MTHAIKPEIIDLYKELKNENPRVAEDMVMIFLENMPDEAISTLTEMKYGKHIISKSSYEKGLKYIKGKDGKMVNNWDTSDIMKIASSFIDIESKPYYDYDLFLWSNIKKADYEHLISDPAIIIKMAICDLEDADFPYFDSSERAYRWVKAHEEKEEKKY